MEFDLVAGELDEIDRNLERAEHALNWNSESTLYSFKSLITSDT